MATREYQNLSVLRVILATMVTWSHCYPLLVHSEPVAGIIPTDTGGSIAVKAFFYVSGVLVTQSWHRAPLVSVFLMARLSRIYPALVISILLSGILALTSVSDGQVQGTREFLDYVTNNLQIIKGVDYEIAGAYASNPGTHSVNGSLWTLPWELRCYIMVILLGLVGVLNTRAHAFLWLMMIMLSWQILPGHERLVDNLGVPLMVMCFFLGVLSASGQIMPSPRNFLLVSVVAGYVVSKVLGADWGVTIVICGITHAIAFGSIRLLPSVTSDLSFGIYVYSFAIQQFLLSRVHGLTPMMLFMLTMLVVIPAAYFSWRYVESPVLELNRKFARKIKRAQG